jgi:hypothetical protein
MIHVILFAIGGKNPKRLEGLGGSQTLDFLNRHESDFSN